jgi:xanthine dehydrogenase accessory factor
VLLRLMPGDGGTETDGSLDGAVIEHNPCLSGGTLEIFLEPQVPVGRLVVVGDSPIARAVEKVAAAAGYDAARPDVEDVHPSGGDAAVIVASHGSGEERVLAEALAAGVPYVALVASAPRGAAVRAELEVPDPLRGQLHTPAGLAIGARTPDEIAISILAEVISDRNTHPASVPALTASALDPVCGMEVAVSETTLYLDVADERVFFCGLGCREAYAREHAAR